MNQLSDFKKRFELHLSERAPLNSFTLSSDEYEKHKNIDQSNNHTHSIESFVLCFSKKKPSEVKGEFAECRDNIIATLSLLRDAWSELLPDFSKEISSAIEEVNTETAYLYSDGKKRQNILPNKRLFRVLCDILEKGLLLNLFLKKETCLKKEYVLSKIFPLSIFEELVSSYGLLYAEQGSFRLLTCCKRISIEESESVFETLKNDRYIPARALIDDIEEELFPELMDEIKLRLCLKEEDEQYLSSFLTEKLNVLIANNKIKRDP